MCTAPRRLASSKDTSQQTQERACSCLSTVQFANGPKRSMGHVPGAEKDFFLIRVADRRSHHAAAPVESCQSLSKRSPWGRLGSVQYTCNRLHRTRRRFQHISANSLISAAHWLFFVYMWGPGAE